MPQSENTWPTTVSTVTSGVRRRPWLIPVVAIVVGALTFAVSSLMPSKYEATARLVFQPTDPAPRIDPTTSGPEVSSTPERTAATNLALAEAAADASAPVVRRRLRSGLSVEDLRKRIALTPEGQADIVTITATGDSAAESARMANTFASEIVALRRRRAQDRVQRVIDAINQRVQAQPPPASATTLQARAEQLQVEKALQTGDVDVAEPAVPPPGRSSPHPLLNGFIGLLLGALLGVGLAAVLRRQDRPVEDEEDLETIVAADVLARVPYRSESATGRQHFREALHFLRTNLQLREDARRARVIGLVSPTPGHGKSVVAVGLCDALATSGSDVIAIDCDLRRPALHRYLHGNMSPGVVDVIDGSDESSSLLQETSHAGVRLVAAGATLSESTSSTIGLGRITRLLKSMRQAGDYVIVDTSAVTIGADSTVVAKALDGVIMVVDLKVVDRDVLAAATDQLRGAGVRIFGIVLNRADGFQPRWRSGTPGIPSLRGRRDDELLERPRPAAAREASPVRAAPQRQAMSERERPTETERGAKPDANGAGSGKAAGAPRSGRAARSSGRTPPRRSDRRST